MSTLATTNIKHPSAANPAIILDSDGKATVAGMGLVHINTTTFSAVSSVSLNNVFTSDYDNYRIFFTATASTTANAAMRLRVGGVDASNGTYGQAGYYAYINAAVSGFSSNGGVGLTSWPQTAPLSTLSESGFIMDIQNPARSVSTFGVHHTNGVDAQYLYAPRGVRHTTATAYDGFSLISSSGNMSGTVRVYGYKNS